MGHFCCNILDLLLTSLTLFYFNLLAHIVDLGKQQNCGSAVVSILFSKDVNVFTQIMGNCEKKMINTFCVSFSLQNYFRVILNTNNYPASQEVPNYLLIVGKYNLGMPLILWNYKRNTDCKFLKLFVLKARIPLSVF